MSLALLFIPVDIKAINQDKRRQFGNKTMFTLKLPPFQPDYVTNPRDEKF